MTNSEIVRNIRAMHQEGTDAWGCLMYAIDNGLEYPDAVYLVTRALKLTRSEVNELEEEYQYR